MKPLNLLAFLLGFSLAFPFLSHASCYSDDVISYDTSWINMDNTPRRPLGDTVLLGIGETAYYRTLFYVTETHYSKRQQSRDFLCNGTQPANVPESSECSDGLLSDGETGIDCGGSCSDSCDSSICENQSATLSDGLCSEHTAPDAFGNCPFGTTLIYTDDANVCATSPVPAIQYFSGDLQDPSGDVVDDGFFAGVDFPLSGVDDPFESGQLSIVESIAPTSTVDNGDGTSTVTTTTTTTTTNNEGDVSTSTSTNSFNIDNGTGNKIDGTEQTITDDEIPVEATPLIAAPDGLDFGDKLTDLLNSSSAEFESYVDDVQGSDLVQHFTDVFTLPDDPGDSPLTISMGAYGVHLVDSQMMDTTLSLVGQVLVVCAFIAGAYIVFRKQ